MNRGIILQALLLAIVVAGVGYAYATRDVLIESYFLSGAAFEKRLASQHKYVKEDYVRRFLADLEPDNGTSAYNFVILNKYLPVIEERWGSMKGLQIVEIGPGWNLALGATMALGGAERYYGVDIWRSPELLDAAPYRTMVSLARIVNPKLLQRPVSEVFVEEGNQVKLDEKRVTFVYPHLSSDTTLDSGSVDFVFSHSGFEHFVTPKETVAEILRVLKPGGVTAHGIDLRDHYDFKKPLEFLKLDAKEWRGRFDDKSLHMYTNRWRAKDFKEAFEAAGFKVLRYEPAKPEGFTVTEEMRASFHPDFQKYSLEDLAYHTLFIVAQKP